MQFSETVVAAMIGAIATVSTALFQLFTVLRNRNKLEIRPKKGRTFRSIVAIVALVIASGVGGYLYAGLRQQSASEEMHNMREELNAKLQLLASTTERLAQSRDGSRPTQSASQSIPTSATSSESVVYAPACPAGTTCAEATGQKLVLCGAIPSSMQLERVELFSKGANAQIAWDQAMATFETDLGGAKFTGAPREHVQDENHKAVCVDFVHWSSEPHLARVVLHYGAASDGPSATTEPTAVATATGGVPAAQSISLIAPSLVK